MSDWALSINKHLFIAIQADHNLAEEVLMCIRKLKARTIFANKRSNNSDEHDCKYTVDV